MATDATARHEPATVKKRITPIWFHEFIIINNIWSGVWHSIYHSTDDGWLGLKTDLSQHLTMDAIQVLTLLSSGCAIPHGVLIRVVIVRHTSDWHPHSMYWLKAQGIMRTVI